MKHTLRKINSTNDVTTYDYRGYTVTAHRSYSIITGKCFCTTYKCKDLDIDTTTKQRVKAQMDKAIDTNMRINKATGKWEITEN